MIALSFLVSTGVTYSDGFLSTVEIAIGGDISDNVIDTFEFDTSYGGEPDMVNVGSDIFAIAYRGPGNDGFLRSLTIEN